MSSSIDDLLGIDLGTQGVRGALFDLRGLAPPRGAAVLDVPTPPDVGGAGSGSLVGRRPLAVMRETMARAGVLPTAVRALSYDCASCNVVVARPRRSTAAAGASSGWTSGPTRPPRP